MMDIGGVSGNSDSRENIAESSVIASEDHDRSFIEISELDKLLGLPPPRFDLGSADIDSFKVLDSENSVCNFDTDIDFAVPQKPGLPERLKMESGCGHESETEICYNKELTKVSVIKTELNIESDGLEIESECNSYLTEPVPELPSPSAQGDMLFKRCVGRGRGSRGSLSRVVSRLLAKGEPLHTILSPNSVCDTPVPKTPTTIPSPVINKLKKLGTSVEVENPNPSSLHTINGQVSAVPEISTSTNSSTPTHSDSIPTGFLEIMETIDKAVVLTSDLTKKKKKRMQKRTDYQVPSTLQLIAEIENSSNLTKFSFQVDAKQVIELPDGHKLFSCDICSGVYHRGFSLKRHYLKTHINYKHISKRDLHNCGILLDPSIEKGGGRKKQLIKDDSPPVVTNLSPPSDIPDLYRCHTCFKCFMLISDLQAHLMEHLPVSVQNMTDEQFKSYTCPICKARYHKKKLYLRHKEMCGSVVEPEIVNTHFCLFCDKTFSTFVQKKLHHLQMHHPKKRLHQCYLCKTKMFKERIGVFKHLILHHPDEYIGCLTCKLRFATRDDYKKHNKESHKPIGVNKKIILEQKISAKKEDVVNVVEHTSEIEQPVNQVNSIMTNVNSDLLYKCTECPKMFASHVNMTRHRRLAHSVHPRTKKRKMIQNNQLILSRKTKEERLTTTPPAPPLSVSLPNPLLSSPLPPTDPEILFYSTISHNIRENLTHHLDGKLDSQEIMEYDLNKTSELRNKVLNFSASFTSDSAPLTQPEASSTPLQHRDSRSIPISPRGQWEKFNFPKNYDGRCGLSSYIKDMSHLDISTQLTMRRNLQRLNSTAGQESSKESPANIPAGLLLVEKPGPDCAETFGEPEDGKDKGTTEALVLSGEWVRPRTYLCAACGYKSTNLWDVEDHKYALHPNVWVPHVEIVGEQSSPWDWIYHRRLPPDTVIEETTPDPPALPPPCSKCQRPSPSLAELHRHMLDCGGDTTWAATMLGVTSPGSRRRKWRPFGSRRRKQTGRRGLRRNIPNTPAKHSCGRIRTKPGDMDTIQKMIANLPPKRTTRRVVGDDIDIKTRSQATISSVPISSVASHSSLARSANMKSIKLGKSSTKLNSQKKNKVEYHSEEQLRKKDVKEEPMAEVVVKKERVEDIFPLEAENTIQHSDILTSLQMIRVVRTNPVVAQEEQVIVEEPIETSKIIAAMREAMLETQERPEPTPAPKTIEKKKKRLPKSEDQNKKTVIKEEEESKTSVIMDLKKTEIDEVCVIICHGCGMKFDSQSACQRHMKKCVYWKKEKSSEDNKNRCVHCGSTFPYLMALLKHNCNKVDLAEEPPMPELCPVKPVEEVQCDSVEEIPILSPVYVAPRDDNAARRISLLENTIKQVGDGSFDLSSYYIKYFKSPKECQDSIKTVVSDVSKVIQTEQDSTANSKNAHVSTQTISEQSGEEPSKDLTATSAPQELCANTSKLQKVYVKEKAKSTNNKQILKINKVSDIFKERKKGGRRRQGIKVKIAPKVLSTKLNLHKSMCVTQSINAKKKQMIANKKRKRSSNFVLLMKEWEQLEKEGAVAMGKRKRRLTRHDINIAQGRSCRRFTSPYNSGDYLDTDSLFTDNSSLYEHLKNRRRSKRTNSFGSLCDFPLIIKEESDLEITEKIDSDLTNNVSTKDETPVVVKRKPGRPRIKNIVLDNNVYIKQEVLEENEDQDKLNVATDQVVIKAEYDRSNKVGNLLQGDVTVQKRKPGRPQALNICEETTDNHTRADSIVKKRKPGRPRSSNIIEEAPVNPIQEVQKRGPGRPRSSNIIEETALNPVQEGQKRGPGRPRSVSTAQEIVDDSVQGDLSAHKRKPGRPRASSITDKTEQHILETIDLIVRESSENINSGKKFIDGENYCNAEKNFVNHQQAVLSQQCLSTIKTEDHVNQTIEDIVNASYDHYLNEEEIKWFNVDDVIYSVSIGSADIFANKNSETPISNSTSDELVKRKRGRPRKRSNNVTQNPKDCLSLKKEECSTSDEVCTNQTQKAPESLMRINNETERQANLLTHIVKVEPEEMKITNSKPTATSTQQIGKGKRKLTFTDSVNDANVNSLPKKVKTKQMLIADYLNISNTSKKPLDNGTYTDEKLVKNDDSASQDLSHTSIDLISKESDSISVVPAEVLLYQSNANEKNSKNIKDKKHKDHKNHAVIDKPHSPSSSSSKEDLALSVIREKVILKRKKKIKLNKLIKNKRLEIIDSKLGKITKPRLPPRDDRFTVKEKLGKRKKIFKVGVSRNHWEVSIVENKNKPVEIFCDVEQKSAQPTTVVPSTENTKKFYCSYCDKKFESSYKLYEHQQTPGHKLKSSPGDKQNNISDDSDPVKYCKSIGNIINDLEKRTLNVAKVMHHLKHRDSTESTNEAISDLVEPKVEPKNSGTKDTKTAEEGWQPEWVTKQEWPSRSATPLWEGPSQSWEVDSFSTGCSSSIGSIMDTVNKLLSSDQEQVPSPTVGGYSWSDLQQAMGVSDEEMAMLEQLGEHSLQEEYVYDSTRPLVDWPTSEDSPTLTDLDHPEQSPSPSLTPTTSFAPDVLLEVKKQEPISDSEESKVCRGAIGRPRRMLGDYENKEMVCPTCNKHFLGLPALQTHVSWSHCTSGTGNSTRLVSGLKRRALLSGDEVDRRLVCFVCKEIVPSASLLEAHIQAQHTKKLPSDIDPPKPILLESERLKSKMSLALGGLVDKALDKVLGSNKPAPSTQSDVNTGALQLLGKICAARKRVDSENIKLSPEMMQLLSRLRQVSQKDEGTNRVCNSALANEMRAILSRGRPIGVSKGALQASVSSTSGTNTTELKPTNLLDHLAVCSSDVQERPYACPICDLRFLIPSTRNRHIARAHGKYGRRYDEEAEDFNGQDDLDSGWKDSLDPCIEANDDGEMLPLCSDCGLSFQSIHEVMQHRIEDHPRRFSADGFQEDSKASLVLHNLPIVESSTEIKQPQRYIKSEDIKSLPVSDNSIDSTSTLRKKRGRPVKSPDAKTECKRKDSESENTQKCNSNILCKKNDLKGTSHTREECHSLDDVSDSLWDSNGGESNKESNSQESDKTFEKMSDALFSSQNSSDENLAELSKKLDRRKVRVGNMAEEAVRVKAEAALRELNLLRKGKSPSSAAKWGINAVKFTKQSPVSSSPCEANGSISKPRFTSLVDKKWKIPSSIEQLLTPNKELLEDVKPDIYDFNDEDSDTNKKPFQQFKDSHPEPEHSESNNSTQSLNCYSTGSPKKANYSSKLNSDNS